MSNNETTSHGPEVNASTKFTIFAFGVLTICLASANAFELYLRVQEASGRVINGPNVEHRLLMLEDAAEDQAVHREMHHAEERQWMRQMFHRHGIPWNNGHGQTTDISPIGSEEHEVTK